MPIPTFSKFADKIKQRKQFKDRKDKKKSALNYIEKKYKEAEKIVKKQYGSPDDVPKGKFYGTLMIILKNKLHVNENLSESPDSLYGEKDSLTFIYWKDKSDFVKDMKKAYIHPEGFIEEENIKFPLLVWTNGKKLMFNKKRYGESKGNDHGALVDQLLKDRKGSMRDNSFDGRDWGTNSGRLSKFLISLWGNKVSDDMIRFIIDTADIKFKDEIKIETPKGNTNKRRYENKGDISIFRVKDKKQEKRTRSSVSPIDAVRARKYPGLKFESKFEKMYQLIMEN